MSGIFACFESIIWAGEALAYIIRAEMRPSHTTFLTPSELNLQAGFVVYPAGGEIARHIHKPLERHIIGTSEVLIVKEGQCLVDFYNDAQELVATRDLRTGDTVLLVSGGHGFRMLEDTILLEIKQGPYVEMGDKEQF